MIARVREWIGRTRLRLALVASLWILAVLNLRFWRDVVGQTWQPTWRHTVFLASLAAMLYAIHVWLLRLVPGRRAPGYVAAAMIVIGAIAAHFLDRLGVFMDVEMLRNVAQTDPGEVGDLVTPALLGYTVLLGLVPAAVMAGVQVPAETPGGALRARFAATALMLLAVGLLALGSSAAFASFLREHKPLRYLINPASVLVSSSRLTATSLLHTVPAKLVDTGGPLTVQAPKTATRPLLIFFVIGETARAANFGLGGYARQTTPELAARSDLLYFRDVTACGTSTAYSLPCMLSPKGRENFDIDSAGHETNVLDVFRQAGFQVTWFDNNSGCKRLCSRVNYRPFAKPAGQARCNAEHCFDTVMTRNVAESLRAARGSQLVVFHQVGSHGPAYFERYPPQFEKFRPACHTRELAECDQQAIVNAYDDSLVYTDHVLAEQIRLLESLGEVFDSALLYVSDHGESLGENGLYLHGAPYFMAPDTQTKVPMVLWLSAGYRESRGIDAQCLAVQTSVPASHDNLYHTLLGMAGLRNAAYRKDRNLLAPCI